MVEPIARTALELSPSEWRQYDPISAIDRRQAASRADIVRRRRRALRTARKAARLLQCSFGASKVVVFGSLAKRGGFSLWSDIDLAVWGIHPHQFYASVAAVTGLSSEFKIDLVDPLFCSPSLHREIEQTGVELT